MSYVHFVVMDGKNNGKFNIVYLATMQTKINKKTTTAITVYDELDSKIIQV